MTARQHNLIQVQPDGLPYNDVGLWTEEKHRLVAYYASEFSGAMKDKFQKRVYIELYAGAGYSRIRGTDRIIPGSPINALGLDVPFDKYIFCEENTELRQALETRVRRHSSKADVTFIPGNCDAKVGEIAAAIPRYSKANKVLSLCFVDPNDIGIKFVTLQTLATRRIVDFVVLLALYMDALRAEQQYVRNPSKINQLLGGTWKDRWIDAKRRGVGFPLFLAEEFIASMKGMGYIPPPLHSMRKIFYYEKNFPLYAVGLFSRHPLAYKLWDDALKYTKDQLPLF
ncbi:MAG TPA: three-Cys-motif partner protein TcmP [Candidatus Sulfotelmatobacter sp.]|nr:three-Cys-motif partner protein TcmP [Candidatus Sulfotelmatobacter sp.]